MKIKKIDETLFRSIMKDKKEFDKKIIESLKLRHDRELNNLKADRLVNYNRLGYSLMSETLNASHLTVKDKKKTLKAINKVLKDFDENNALMVKMGVKKALKEQKKFNNKKGLSTFGEIKGEVRYLKNKDKKTNYNPNLGIWFVNKNEMKRKGI